MAAERPRATRGHAVSAELALADSPSACASADIQAARLRTPASDGRGSYRRVLDADGCEQSEQGEGPTLDSCWGRHGGRSGTVRSSRRSAEGEALERSPAWSTKGRDEDAFGSAWCSPRLLGCSTCWHGHESVEGALHGRDAVCIHARHRNRNGHERSDRYQLSNGLLYPVRARNRSVPAPEARLRLDCRRILRELPAALSSSEAHSASGRVS